MSALSTFVKHKAAFCEGACLFLKLVTFALYDNYNLVTKHLFSVWVTKNVCLKCCGLSFTWVFCFPATHLSYF